MVNDVWSLPFKTKKVHIEAVDRYGDGYSKIIAVEKIVYLCDTGRMYIIGEEHNQNRRSIVEFSRIKKVEATEYENHVYNNKEVRNICDEMLRISTDEPHEVIVEFENTGNIKEDLERYMQLRVRADLKETEDKLIYTDKIRGIDDFAKWIRKYGKSCKVTEDEMLRKKIIASSKKIIERYESHE